MTGKSTSPSSTPLPRWTPQVQVVQLLHGELSITVVLSGLQRDAIASGLKHYQARVSRKSWKGTAKSVGLIQQPIESQ